MGELKTSIVIEAEDRFSARAKQIGAVSKGLGKAVGKTAQELTALGKRDKTLAAFRELDSRLGKAAAEMDKARRRASELGRKLKETGIPTKALDRATLKLSAAQKKLAGESDAAARAAARAAEAHRREKSGLAQLGEKLRGAGIDTRKLAAAQKGLARDIDAATRKMEGLGAASERLARRRTVLERRMQSAARASLIGGEISRVGQGVFAAAVDPARRALDVERARGELMTLGLSSEDADVIVARGRDLSARIAGISSPEFAAAAYDIRSGVADTDDAGRAVSLDAASVAELTEIAALMGRATKASTAEMSDVLSAGYGAFKQALYADRKAGEFGGIFAAQVAAAVQGFKTTGSKMQQAIASMGAGLAQAGVSLSEQFAVLGMLQAKMPAGEAGTALAALARTAAVAQERFAAAGVSIRTLDAGGNLRSLPELLEDVERVFGADFSTAEQRIIQEAFGSDEAVKFFTNLYGQADDLRDAARAQKEAAEQGKAFVASMAARRDDNDAAPIDILIQRWAELESRLGGRTLESMDGFINKLNDAVDWLDRTATAGGDLERLLSRGLGLGAVVGAAATAFGPMLVAVASTRLAMSGVAAAATRASIALDGIAGIGGLVPGGGAGGGKSKSAAGKPGPIRRLSDKIKGFAARGGRGGRLAGATARIGQAVTGNRLGGALAKAARGVAGSGAERLAGSLGKGSLAGAGLTAAMTLPTLFDDEASGVEKAQAAGGAAGLAAGGLAGAKLGAMIGAFGGPFAAGAGGLIGGAVGAFAGEAALRSATAAAAAWFDSDEAESEAEEAGRRSTPRALPFAAAGLTALMTPGIGAPYAAAHALQTAPTVNFPTNFPTLPNITLPAPTVTLPLTPQLTLPAPTVTLPLTLPALQRRRPRRLYPPP